MVLSKVYVKIVEADGTVTEMKFSISKATMRSCKKIIEHYIEREIMGEKVLKVRRGG